MCARNTRILSDRALLPIRTKTGWCALLRRDSPFALAAAGSASLIQRKFDDQKPGDRNFCSSIAAPLFQPAGRHRLAAKENFRLITLCGKPRPRGPCKLRPIHNSMSGFRPDRHRKRTRRPSGASLPESSSTAQRCIRKNQCDSLAPERCIRKNAMPQPASLLKAWITIFQMSVPSEGPSECCRWSTGRVRTTREFRR